jgi:hypothetical protein
MKAKLKSQAKDSSVSIGANAWDGTVEISGRHFEPGKEYEINKYEFETGLFEMTSAPKKKGKKDE